MAAKDTLPVLPFESQKAFERWLKANHAKSPGIWIKFAKKGSGIATVTYAEAVESALCWGWIDAQSKSIDAVWYIQHFTARGPRSKWSAINVGKIEKLTAAGRMQPAGIAAVEAAKADGRWAVAYASPRAVTVPDDFAAALADVPGTAEAFAALRSMERYSVLYQIHDARRPETRARRIAKYVAQLAGGTLAFRPAPGRKAPEGKA